MAYTRAWDETLPLDTQLANLLGQDIRQLEQNIRERIVSFAAGPVADRPTPEAVWGSANDGVMYFSTDEGKIYRWNNAAWVDITALFFYSHSAASVDLIAQVANAGPSTLLTPAANGLYLISGYETLTTPATTSSTLPNISITWQDIETGASLTRGPNIMISGTAAGVSSNTTQACYIMTPFPIRAATGVAITYQGNSYASVGGTAMQYSLHLKAQLLN